MGPQGNIQKMIKEAYIISTTTCGDTQGNEQILKVKRRVKTISPLSTPPYAPRHKENESLNCGSKSASLLSFH